MGLITRVRDLRHLRCWRYAMTIPAWQADLRGLPLFKSFRYAALASRLLGGHARVHIADSLDRRPCPDEALFLPMPSRLDVADLVEWRAGQPHLPTIVDVFADVLRMVDQPDEAMVRAGREGATPEAWRWWYHPDRQAAITRCITAADVVTTPWPALVGPLRAVNRNVVLMPDFHRRDPHPFQLGIMQACALLDR